MLPGNGSTRTPTFKGRRCRNVVELLSKPGSVNVHILWKIWSQCTWMLFLLTQLYFSPSVCQRIYLSQTPELGRNQALQRGTRRCFCSNCQSETVSFTAAVCLQRPSARVGHTSFIADDRGHLLPGVKVRTLYPLFSWTGPSLSIWIIFFSSFHCRFAEESCLANV